jgi:hypothetical protein
MPRIKEARERSSVRFQADLSAKDAALLDLLKKELDIRSNAELLSEAIAIMGWAVREKRSGRTVASVEENTPVRELVAPLLDRAALASYLPRVETAWTREEVINLAKLMSAEPPDPADALVTAVRATR